MLSHSRVADLNACLIPRGGSSWLTREFGEKSEKSILGPFWANFGQKQFGHFFVILGEVVITRAQRASEGMRTFGMVLIKNQEPAQDHS